jgi:hypothetical protein
MNDYPLKIESVGEDTYIVMSRGHHDLDEFMVKAVQRYPNWLLGGPKQAWCKTTPTEGGSAYHIVEKGARGAWPATFCYERGENHERYNAVDARNAD